MKFLLNSNIKIFTSERVEQLDGAFLEEELLIGSFFCSTRIVKKDMIEHLTVILRESPQIEGELKVFFTNKIYKVNSVSKVAGGFLKLICKR